MTEIISSLYLGSYRFADNAEFRRESQVTSYISIGDHVRAVNMPEEAVNFPVSSDGTLHITKYAKKVADLIQTSLEGGGRCLVYCNDGNSLSATFVVAYLVIHGEMRLTDATQHVEAALGHKITILPLHVQDLKLFDSSNILRQINTPRGTEPRVPILPLDLLLRSSPRDGLGSPAVSPRQVKRPLSAGRERRPSQQEELRRPLSAGRERRAPEAPIVPPLALGRTRPSSAGSTRRPLGETESAPSVFDRLNKSPQRERRPADERQSTLTKTNSKSSFSRTPVSPRMQQRVPSNESVSEPPLSARVPAKTKPALEGLQTKGRFVHPVGVTATAPSGASTPRGLTNRPHSALPPSARPGTPLSGYQPRPGSAMFGSTSSIPPLPSKTRGRPKPKCLVNSGTLRSAVLSSLRGDAAFGRAVRDLLFTLPTAAPAPVSEPQPSSPERPSASEDTPVSQQPALIMDIGSLRLRLGRLDDDGPRVDIPNVVGQKHTTPIPSRGTPTLPKRDLFIGQECLDFASALTLSWPASGLKDGTNFDMDRLQLVIAAAFEQLGAEPSAQPLVISKSPYLTIGQETQLLDMFLVTLKFYTDVEFSSRFESEPAMAMLSSGSRTGICVMLGDARSYACPVFEGYAILDAVVPIAATGAVMTRFLHKHLLPEDVYLNSTEAQARDIKETMCSVAMHYGLERATMSKNPELHTKEYVFTDGRILKLSDEIIRCPEILFNPQVIRMSGNSVQQAIVQAALKSNAIIRDSILCNVVVFGGGAQLPNLVRRLTEEVTLLIATNADGEKAEISQTTYCEVSSSDSETHAVWRGAAIRMRPDTFSNDDDEDDMGGNKPVLQAVDNDWLNGAQFLARVM